MPWLDAIHADTTAFLSKEEFPGVQSLCALPGRGKRSQRDAVLKEWTLCDSADAEAVSEEEEWTLCDGADEELDRGRRCTPSYADVALQQKSPSRKEETGCLGGRRAKKAARKAALPLHTPSVEQDVISPSGDSGSDGFTEVRRKARRERTVSFASTVALYCVET
eukprot:TRINITY_DN71141_c0_g1_i1.p1 TRINITY_DN71141_c0_g1~~TRINITY_DN71141_c0_g1_i1.p1  ORF type:complete len:165 (+),score=34.36 TRINITY_DN71141_c0_g1_i1:56-550(+)